MANNPIHTIAAPLGVNFVNSTHDPRDDAQLGGFYDTFSDVVSVAVNVPAKDQAYLTVNDWVFAARIASGDIYIEAEVT